MKYKISFLEIICWLLVGGIIYGFVKDDVQVSFWFFVTMLFVVALDCVLFFNKYKRYGRK